MSQVESPAPLDTPETDRLRFSRDNPWCIGCPPRTIRTRSVVPSGIGVVFGLVYDELVKVVCAIWAKDTDKRLPDFDLLLRQFRWPPGGAATWKSRLLRSPRNKRSLHLGLHIKNMDSIIAAVLPREAANRRVNSVRRKTALFLLWAVVTKRSVATRLATLVSRNSLTTRAHSVASGLSKRECDLAAMFSMFYSLITSDSDQLALVSSGFSLESLQPITVQC